MKFDFASIVDQEFENLVWTGSDRVNRLIDKEQGRISFYQRICNSSGMAFSRSMKSVVRFFNKNHKCI